MRNGNRPSSEGLQKHRRWATIIKERTVLVLGSVTAAGLALVALGWSIQGSSYLPGLFMQLGTSMMLLVPLALLGLMLEDRIRHTEEELRATAARLETLTAVTREGLAAGRQQRDTLYERAKRTPQQDMVRALINDATEIGAIDPLGARVLVPGTSLRLRFRQQDNSIQVQVEELDGSAVAHLAWNEGESPETFAQHLAKQLRIINRYPGDAYYDPTTILRQLLETVHLGVRARTGEHFDDLGHLIEVPNDHWAVSSEGLYSLQHHYHIPTQSLISSHDDWPRHMRTMAWVDTTAFEEAYHLACRLLDHQ